MSLSGQTPTCQTCADENRPGGCARLRCYCGHKTCWAYTTWAKAKAEQPAKVRLGQNKHQAKSWAERSGPTWLDK